MRGVVAWAVTAAWMLALLSGCAGTPQSRESGATVLAGVLGVEDLGEGFCIRAAAEGRGSQGPFHCESWGQTPAAAVEDLTDRAEQVVSCAHVEHWLVDESAVGELSSLLSYAFQEPQQSTETQLWVFQGGGLDRLFDGEQDVARRMTVLKAQGKDKQGFSPVTLREAAEALAGEEALLLPALRVEGEKLVFAGFGLYQDGEILRWLRGEEALGAALLQGERIHWTGSVGESSIVLQSLGCWVVPQWDGGTLAGLSIRCRLEGTYTGGWQKKQSDAVQLEQGTAQAMRLALHRMQAAGVDAAGLLGRAGLHCPVRWSALEGQWAEKFPGLSIDLRVEAALETET